MWYIGISDWEVVILENPQDDAIAHLFGGFFYALNDIYTQGGIYNNHITIRTANNLFQT